MDDQIYNHEGGEVMGDSKDMLAKAQTYEADMVRFLRELIAIPSESGQEGRIIQHIQQEIFIEIQYHSHNTNSISCLLWRML